MMELIASPFDLMREAKEGWPQMPEQAEYAGIAALTICEALLLAMSDRDLLPEHEVVGVLRDAAASHENAAGPETDADMHRTVAALINQIIAGGNWARRS